MRDNSFVEDNFAGGASLFCAEQIFLVTEVYCDLPGLLVGGGGGLRWAQERAREGPSGGPGSPISAPADPENTPFLATFPDFAKTEVPGER